MNTVAKKQSTKPVAAVAAQVEVSGAVENPAPTIDKEALQRQVRLAGLVKWPAYQTLPEITDTVVLKEFDFVKGGKLPTTVNFDGKTWSIRDYTCAYDGVHVTLVDAKDDAVKSVVVDTRLLFINALYAGRMPQVLAGQLIEKAWSTEYPNSVQPFPVVTQELRAHIETSNTELRIAYETSVDALAEELLALSNVIPTASEKQLVNVYKLIKDNGLTVIKAGINIGKLKSLSPLDDEALTLDKEGTNEDTGETYYIYSIA